MTDGAETAGPIAAGAPAAPAAAADLTRDLVRAARAGDRAAFGELYRRYSGMVHGILLARLPRSEVGDTLQETFLRALRTLGSLRDESAFGGWLATLARTAAADRWRRRPPAAVELPRDVADAREAGPGALALLEVVRALPPAYAETLTLRLVEGMTGPEIAERTGLTPESVRVNLCRGMKLLRRSLGEPGA